MAVLFYAWWFGFWVSIGYSMQAQDADDWRWDLSAVITAALWPVTIAWQLRR